MTEQRKKSEGFQATFESVVETQRDQKKFYLPESGITQVLEYFMERLSSKYPLAFAEDLAAIKSKDFHDTCRYFKLVGKNPRFKGSKFYFPGTAIAGMMASLIEEIHKYYRTFPLSYQIEESLKVECNQPAVKKFTCKMKLKDDGEEQQIFYVHLGRKPDGGIKIATNLGSWLEDQEG